MISSAQVHTHWLDPLEACNGPLQGSQLGVKIKWPNDIYCDNFKLGGILCHSTYRDHKFHLVAGIGLNLDNREPTTCINALVEAKQRAAGLGDPFATICKEVSALDRCARGSLSQVFVRSMRWDMPRGVRFFQ